MRYNICKITCWLASLLMVANGTTSAQEKSDVFRARFAATRNSAMNISVSKSDTIDLSHYLNTRAPIYSLSVDATIEQPREASFTRIVLEDSDGKDWLVMECDRFRNDTSVINLREYCQETALLFGIIPSCLKCYVAGDATLRLTGIHISDQRPDRGEEQTAEKQAERHAALREDQVKAVVASINEYNRKHGKLWRADVTDWALAEFNKNGDHRESDPYLANFKFYTDGIYEVGERQNTPIRETSQYAESFDWRFRHGRDTTYWITPLRDQGTYGYCRAFAAIGAIEAVTNLYFNDSLGLDLSEQDVILFSEIAHTPGGNPMNYFFTTGVIDENTLPYNPPAYTNMNSQPYGLELIKAEDYAHHVSINSSTTKESFWNSLKSNLLSYGPGYWGFGHNPEDFAAYEGSAFSNHYMTLVGWGTCTPNIYQTYVDSDTIIGIIPGSYSPLLGETYWIFKDSFGHRKDHITKHNGYRYIIFNDFSKVFEATFLSNYITRRGHSDSEIVVEDRDYDGYFNWGIGNRPNDRLPAWAEQDEDSDDSNPEIGTMDNKGHPIEVEDNYLYVSSDLTKTDSWFQRSDIEIGVNKKLTLKGTVVFHPNTTIYFMTGSVLTIDGGIIVDPTFSLSNTNTATLIIKNGGKLLFTPKTGSFSHPLGLNIQILNGEINYVENFW